MSWVIINGVEIHSELVGESIVGSHAYGTRKYGYHICEVCNAVIKKSTFSSYNMKAHTTSKRHKVALLNGCATNQSNQSNQ